MSTPPVASLAKRFHIYGYEPNRDLILEALRTPDEIGRILRVHLALEQQMNGLIDHVAKRVVSKSASFAAKVISLRCMGIENNSCDVLESFNNLRNKFAHNPRATVANNKSIAEKIIGHALHDLADLGAFQVHFSETDKDLHKFSDLEIGQKILVIGAIYASYLGNMPHNRVFSPPASAPVPKKT